WLLTDALAANDSTDAALAAYASLRTPRVTRIVDAATRNVRVYHARGLRRLALHSAFRAAALVAPGVPLRRFDWLYGHDVTTRTL
ncbi:MAG: monooxygenase, partial [Paracoccaceae bacterium]